MNKVIRALKKYLKDMDIRIDVLSKFLIIRTTSKSYEFDNAYDDFYVKFYYDYLKINLEEKEIVIQFVTGF